MDNHPRHRAVTSAATLPPVFPAIVTIAALLSLSFSLSLSVVAEDDGELLETDEAEEEEEEDACPTVADALFARVVLIKRACRQ